MSVSYEPGEVAILRLTSPEKRNAIDVETASQIEKAVTEFTSDNSCSVLIVTGSGGAFCAGADLTAAEELGAMERGRSGPLGFSANDPGKVTIAAIEGPCVAGGMELAAWCDFRIAGEGAYFGAFNRRWGVPFIDGGTWRFPAIMGLGNALYLIETGARLSAAQAMRIGFVQEVVEDGSAFERASALAQVIAGYPQGSMRADRSAAIDGFGRVRLDALEREAEMGRRALNDPALQAGLERFVSGQRPEPPAAGGRA